MDGKFEGANLSSKGKNFLIGAINDFILTFFALLSYFLIGSNVASNFNGNKLYTSYLDQLNEFDKSIGLFLYDENNQKVDLSYTSKVYVYNMIANTYYFENKEMVVNNSKVELKEENTLGYTEDGKYVNDFLSNYYLLYRESDDVKRNLPNPYNDKDNKYSYFYVNILSFNQIRSYLSSGVISDTNQYLGNRSIINCDSASKMLSYLNSGNIDNDGYDIFQKFQSCIENAYSKAVAEIETKSSRYNLLCNELQSLESEVYGSHIIAFSVCFFVSAVMLNSIVPLVFSKGKTIGNLITNTYVVGEDSEPINRFKGFLRGLVSILPSLIIYGTFIIFFFSYAVKESIGIFGFPLQVVVAFSAIWVVISILMMLCTKCNQFLEDKVCATSTCDSID